MPILPKAYETPNGRLRFVVVVDSDGDVTLGFDGHRWQTHADVLTELASRNATKAVRNSLDDRSVIALLSIKGCLADVWVTNDPAQDARNVQDAESVEFRSWSGLA